jgi:hypothetical protein
MTTLKPEQAKAGTKVTPAYEGASNPITGTAYVLGVVYVITPDTEWFFRSVYSSFYLVP